MRNVVRIAGAVAALAVLVVPSALSAGAAQPAESQVATAGRDSYESPRGEKRNALRDRALQLQLSGAIPANTKVARVAKGQYVELAREGEDSILTVLGEFGNATATHHGGIHAGGAPGPLRNQIPAPNRATDNTTIWTPDFSQPYYDSLLFNDSAGANSMRNFYKEQSANRYAVNGAVTNWATVPYNARSYGSNYCGGIVCQDTWRFVNDSVDGWAATMSTAALNAYLVRFDVWDRYDADGDGNFNEPDGYIDHFQSIHAGVGEETGGGAQGSDAIWSHRWYAYFAANGPDGTGPGGFGGVRIGNSNYWIGDYTIEPENGGVGVFAHEFSHDLGLPDLYDTSGNTGGAENSTGFWTLMSSGSYGNDGTQDLGSKPIGYGAWEKFQLGWLNYEVARWGQKSEHKVGPSVYNTKQAQGVFVVLPKSMNGSTTTLGTPTEGANAWYSTAGDNIDVSMTRDVSLPAAASITLSMKAWYEIETCWDYAYVRVSTNGGATYTNLAMNVSDAGNENGQNLGNGITGISGTPKACDAASGAPAWVPVSADLTPYAGQTVKLQIRYWTDGAVQGRGFELDELAITAGSSTVFADGAEAGDNGWTLAGFRRTTGTDSVFNNHYYLAENRQYTGYDDGLRTGPYNFGFLNTLPKYAERFPYQDGLLVSYWDTGQSDNNVGDHPGQGLILPVDANPQVERWADGSVMRPRIQAYDSTFGLQATNGITLHKGGVPAAIPSKPATPVFNDTLNWWNASDPGDALGFFQARWAGVDVPKTGMQIRVKSETPGGFTQIEVSPVK